jgi:hypothetical protein
MGKIFDNSAFGYWLLAFGQKNKQQPQRLSSCDPLPIGIGFGTGIGSRLGHPWVELNKRFCLQQKLKKEGWGLAEERRQRAAKDQGIGKSRVIGRPEKLAKCYGKTLCHRHDHHKEIATIAMG